MRRRTPANPPYWIKAKFKSVCPETLMDIHKGDECLYVPSGRKVYHTTSLTAKDWRSQSEADSLCLGDAGW